MSEAQGQGGGIKGANIPGMPDSSQVVTFNGFTTINTKPTRPAIEDTEMYWCDNWFPLGPNNLRSTPGQGIAIYSTVPGSAGTINEFFHFNIGTRQECAIVSISGTLTIIDTLTSAVLLTTGAIFSVVNNVAFSQWGQKYLLIIAPNGYWVWDGTVLYSPGGVSGQTDITNGGSGGVAGTYALGFSYGTAAGTFVVSGGSLLSITITSSGTGYTSAPTLSFAAAPGLVGAVASILVMPSGVVGNCVETYQGRVWVGNGPDLQFGSPGSPFDFDVGSGAGASPSSDSFLKVGYTDLHSTNGFLYTVADSSVNYISGVSTAGSPAITTYANLNVDPQIGSSWRSTVIVYSRDVLFANQFGVHKISGGTVEKISTQLDGIFEQYTTNSALLGNFQPSSAVAIVFGIRVYSLLIPIIDFYTGEQRNALIMWNGKGWFTASQESPLTFIGTQEFNSNIRTWATDGTSIFPIYSNYNATLFKVVQSKFFQSPTYITIKNALRLWALYSSASGTGTAINFCLDTPVNSICVQATFGASVAWENDSFVVVQWVNSTAATITWVSQNNPINYFETDISQAGELIGFTVTSSSSNVTLIETSALPQVLQVRI